MMDEDTITIGYREWRGEPRKHSDAVKAGEPMGDCIDCMACVNVCPMGIDIRDGQQMECITCGLCIDACDDIMAKTGKPRGLVDYFALKDEPAERAGGGQVPIWKHVFRPRTILYTGLWALVGVGLIIALLMRSSIDMTVAPVRNPQFVTLSDGSIRNAYDIRLRNMFGDNREFEITATSEAALRVEIEGEDVGDTTVTVPVDETRLVRVYVMADRDAPAAAAERTDLRFWVQDLESGDQSFQDTIFNGKGN